MSRRALRSLHVTMARHAAEQTAASPLVPSRTVAQLSVAQLDEAGAALLPDDDQPEPKRCIYCGGVNEAADEFYCSQMCAISALGDVE